MVRSRFCQWLNKGDLTSLTHSDQVSRHNAPLAGFIALFISLFAGYIVGSTTACKPGWSGEAFQFVEEQVEDKRSVNSAREQILEDTRSTFSLNEVDISTGYGEAWPVPPIDSDGEKVDKYFFGRVQGMVDVPVTGQYKLYLTSDDGSILYIDGERVSVLFVLNFL
jgi:hypothetical protein